MVKHKKSIWLWLAILLLYAAIPCHASNIFNPIPFETTTVYSDPLRVSERGTAFFSCVRTSHKLAVDSTVWLIDGEGIEKYGLSAFETGLYSDSAKSQPVYCGTMLQLDGQTAESLFSGGVHMVQLAAKYSDSTVSASWFFKVKRVEYKQFLADIVIDTFYSTYDLISGWMRYTHFRIVAASKMDTSVFGSTCTDIDSQIDYDTADICRQFISRMYSSRPFQGTLTCFLFQCNLEPGLSANWLFSKPVSSFFQGSALMPPFPLEDAIRSFDLYLNTNSKPKAYITLTRPIKLGPTLDFNAGDPGWSLTAKYDASYWYLTHGVGGGDCPAGCTQWSIHEYKISSDGLVVDLSASSTGKRDIGVGHGIAEKNSNLRYNLLGRQLYGERNGVVVKRLKSGLQRQSVYRK